MSIIKNKLEKEEMMDEIPEGLLKEILSDSKVGRHKSDMTREVFRYLWKWKKMSTNNIIVWLKSKGMIDKRIGEDKCKGRLKKCIYRINKLLSSSEVYKVKYRIVYGSNECKFLKGIQEISEWVEKREREKRLAGKTVKVKVTGGGVIPVVTSGALSERKNGELKSSGVEPATKEQMERVEKKVDKLLLYFDGLLEAEDPEIRDPFEAGYSAMEEYKWNEAIDKFRIALAQAQGSHKVALLGLIGNCFYCQGKLQEALGHYKESLSLAIKIGDKEGIATNLGNIGIIYKTKSELDKALKYHKEALKLNREMDRKEGIASNLGNIGITYQTKGKLDEAIEYYEEALKLNREIGNKEGIAINLGNIGTIYQTKGKLDEALKYQKEALKLNREIGNKEGIATNLGNIGIIYNIKGKLDKALEYHKEALKLDREIGNKAGIASDLGNIGLIYKNKGKLDEALKYHKEALKLNREIGNKAGIASDLGNIGIIYDIKGELDEALKYYKEALKIFKQIGAKREIEIIERNIRKLMSERVEIRKKHKITTLRAD